MNISDLFEFDISFKFQQLLWFLTPGSIVSPQNFPGSLVICGGFIPIQVAGARTDIAEMSKQNSSNNPFIKKKMIAP